MRLKTCVYGTFTRRSWACWIENQAKFKEINLRKRQNIFEPSVKASSFVLYYTYGHVPTYSVYRLYDHGVFITKSEHGLKGFAHGMCHFYTPSPCSKFLCL